MERMFLARQPDQGYKTFAQAKVFFIRRAPVRVGAYARI